MSLSKVSAPRRRARPICHSIAVALLVTMVVGLPPSASANSWSIAVVAGSAGQATAGTLAAPTGVTGTCGTGQSKTSVVVTWSAVARATNYTIQQSTTSSTTGYGTVATGVTGTSWTSPALNNNTTAWFKVIAVVGNWSSPASAATAPRTVTGNSCA